MKHFILALGFIVLFSCKMNDSKTNEEKTASETVTGGSEFGSFERIDPAFDDLVSQDARIEKIGEGFKWSEGPVWVEEHKMLLFSDVPTNTIHKWTEERGVEQYLTPSGYSGTGEYSREPGSNGLTLSKDGKLILCQHGDRKVAIMNAPLDNPQAKFITLSDNWNGKKLNSPNDVVVRSNGDVFFTDPPYGLPKQDKDPSKEIPHQGVYKVSGGKTTLIVDSLTRPNGIAFLKGEKTLLVANSDPARAAWYAFDLNEKDEATNPRIFFDATSNSRNGERGLPDGFRVDSNGNVYATGPGGLWIFNGEGKVLGRIRINEPTSNCAFSADEKTLFVTANMNLLRIRLRN
jgi:gluconolactonase